MYIRITLLALLVGCSNSAAVQIEDQIARNLIEACPAVDASSVSAREACAEAIGDSPVLQAVALDVIRWGGQKPGVAVGEALDAANVTEFHPLVWRRLYLSTFMFGSEYRVEEHPPYRVLIMPVRFRNLLPDGEYPYPFWHSSDKWTAYQEATELMMYFREGKLVGALRGGQPDASRNTSPRTWSGDWVWDEGRQPRVTLYTHLFRADNERVDALDAAYRALEAAVRANGCDVCHSPDNPSKMRSLEILSYPAQALSARRTLVSVLEHNEMPPPAGMPEAAERAAMIELARAFVVAADLALARDDELAGR